MPTRKRAVRQSEVVKAFAERLKSLRTARNMTQKDLSTKADITFSYISRLEASGAAPSIDMLQRLAKALGVEIADLLPGPESDEVSQDELKRLFEALLPKAGPETRSMLAMILTRLADSPTARR